MISFDFMKDIERCMAKRQTDSGDANIYAEMYNVVHSRATQMEITPDSVYGDNSMKIVDMYSKYCIPILSTMRLPWPMISMRDAMSSISYRTISNTPAMMTIITNNTYILSNIVPAIAITDKQLASQIMCTALEQAVPLEMPERISRFALEVAAVLVSLRTEVIDSAVSAYLKTAAFMASSVPESVQVAVFSTISTLRESFPEYVFMCDSHHAIRFAISTRYSSMESREYVKVIDALYYTENIQTVIKGLRMIRVIDFASKQCMPDVPTTSIQKNFFAMCGGEDRQKLIRVINKFNRATSTRKFAQFAVAERIVEEEYTEERQKMFIMFCLLTMFPNFCDISIKYSRVASAAVMATPNKGITRTFMAYVLKTIALSADPVKFMLFDTIACFIWPNVFFAAHPEMIKPTMQRVINTLAGSDKYKASRLFGLKLPASTESCGNIINYMLSYRIEASSIECISFFIPDPISSYPRSMYRVGTSLIDFDYGSSYYDYNSLLSYIAAFSFDGSVNASEIPYSMVILRMFIGGTVRDTSRRLLILFSGPTPGYVRVRRDTKYAYIGNGYWNYNGAAMLNTIQKKISIFRIVRSSDDVQMTLGDVCEWFDRICIDESMQNERELLLALNSSFDIFDINDIASHAKSDIAKLSMMVTASLVFIDQSYSVNDAMAAGVSIDVSFEEGFYDPRLLSPSECINPGLYGITQGFL